MSVVNVIGSKTIPRNDKKKSDACQNLFPPPIQIVFDELPYEELRSNYHRGNFWYKRAEVAKTAREEAYLQGLNYIRFLSDFKTIDLCEIEEVFTVPTKRIIDIEGLMGACKPWIDGLRDAHIIAEDDWRHVLKLSGRVVHKKGVCQTDIIIIERSQPSPAK